MSINSTPISSVEAAVKCVEARQNRTKHPDGTFDKQDRWRPSDEEKCACCADIRPPSVNYPFSLMMHCRTVPHIANLFGVNAFELRKAVNAHKKALAPNKSAVTTVTQQVVVQ
jgi:hypothetical protein